MKIIDLDTGELIEELDYGESNFFTSREYWAEYKKWCIDMGKKQNRLFYERFIEGTETEQKID